MMLALVLFLAARPITLEEAIDLAKRGNLEYRESAAEVDRAGKDASSAGGQLLPRLTVDDTVQLWDSKFAVGFPGGPPILIREQVTNTLQLSFTQPLVGLYPLGERWKTTRRLADAARQDHRATRADLIFRTTQAYLRVLEAEDLSVIAEQTIRDIEEQARTARALVAAGTLIEADYLRTEVALAQARQDLLHAQAQLGSSRADLAAVIGLPISTELEPQPIDRNALPRLPESVDQAIAELEVRRPEIAAARARAEAATAARRAAFGQLLPTISAVGAFQHFDNFGFIQPENAAFIGGVLSWNFWEWGSTYRAAQSAEARAVESDLDLQRRRRDASLEATQRFLDARAAFASIEVAKNAVKQAQEAYRVARALYENGSATTTDLLDAQLALERARVNDARAVYDYLVAYHAFARAVGTISQ